ncbi:MAG: hypothetical protein GY749_24215 [Desulfobacteraceae bacterium]|nr:hypothetical protein [Desulfobacteraceae bacterium]
MRTHWDDFKPVTRASLLDGSYMFEPVRMMRTPDGGVCLCSSMDVPVLKGVAIVLNEELRPILGDRCYHIAGMGGDKGAVRDVQAVIDVCKFVFKSDVESYYSSIDHGILMNQVGLLVDDERVLYLVHEYLEHLVDEDGELRLAERGIK